MSDTRVDPDVSKPAARLGLLLRFDPATEARYEAERGPERALELYETGLLGLVFFAAFSFSAVLLTPDILLLTVVARLCVGTPAALLVIQLVWHVSATARERLTLATMVGTLLIQLLLFWRTEAALSNYVFAELTLTLVYANMWLALRFRHAVAFTGLVVLIASLVAATKAGLPFDLRAALIFQLATGALFTLCANYRMERRRCRDYLAELDARLASESAQSDSQRYQNLSLTDALTGLPNRRFLDQRVAAWFAEGHAVAVMMIDIDHFKLFNDTLGHPAGDDCLRSVAALFTRFAQEPDSLFARFGGEEFTLALRRAGGLEAARTATALVSAVKDLGIAHPGRPDGIAVVTVSIGVAIHAAGQPGGPDGVFAAADRALYQAKRRGRDRYAFDDQREGGLALVQ